VCQPTDQAHDHRAAEIIREPGQFIIEHSPQPGRVGRWALNFRPRRDPLTLGSAKPAGPHLPGDPTGDADEPSAHRRWHPDRPAPAGKDEEDGLERIVGLSGDEPAADTVYDRPVPANKFCERGFIPLGCEPREQVGIGSKGFGLRAEFQEWDGHP
jgi:hypothetical protein